MKIDKKLLKDSLIIVWSDGTKQTLKEMKEAHRKFKNERPR